MITATLYFNNIGDGVGLVDDLRKLPELIKPIYFGENEGKIIKENLLSDRKRFRHFQKKNPLGFFLYTENKTFFDISIRNVGYTEATIYLSNKPTYELAKNFFESLIQHKPIFGHACDESEYDHRNRHFFTLGKNHIESWIGRDLDKYIPGIYWYTLLSDELLHNHHVNLVDLSSKAISTKTLSDGSLHLLKYFEDPEDWNQKVEQLDDLCEQTDGVFSSRSVDSAVAEVTNYLEYDEAIAHWR